MCPIYMRKYSVSVAVCEKICEYLSVCRCLSLFLTGSDSVTVSVCVNVSLCRPFWVYVTFSVKVCLRNFEAGSVSVGL